MTAGLFIDFFPLGFRDERALPFRDAVGRTVDLNRQHHFMIEMEMVVTLKGGGGLESRRHVEKMPGRMGQGAGLAWRRELRRAQSHRCLSGL